MSFPRTFVLLAVFIAYLASITGCQHKQPDRVEVYGEITIDGKPLRLGSILFIPVGGSKGPKAGGIVHEGKYKIERENGPIAGKLSVQIRAPALPANTKIPEDISEIAKLSARANELLAPKYNERTELEVTAIIDQSNQFDFKLRSI